MSEHWGTRTQQFVDRLLSALHESSSTPHLLDPKDLTPARSSTTHVLVGRRCSRVSLGSRRARGAARRFAVRGAPKRRRGDGCPAPAHAGSCFCSRALVELPIWAWSGEASRAYAPLGVWGC
jgi:hypothetical protein